jgi:hypothetical protein
MQTYRNTEILAPLNPGKPANSLLEDRSLGPRRLDGPLLRPEQAAELLAVKPSWSMTRYAPDACRACAWDAISVSRRPCSKTGSQTNKRSARCLQCETS